MALGYEGYVQLGTTIALGTGATVPRARSRMESASGYGGRIKTPVAEIGIGTPRAYDWDVYDGSLEMELNRLLFLNELKPWVLDRQNYRYVYFVPRFGAEQEFLDNAFWSSISITASENSAVTASVGLVAYNRTTYDFGTEGPQGYTGNKSGTLAGNTVLCPLGANSPTPLNAFVSGLSNINPIPFWNTQVVLSSVVIPFTNWALEFSQDVVKFFASTDTASGSDPGPKAPEYLAVGPMSAKFSGAYMFKAPLADDLAELDLVLADQTFKMKLLENTSTDDAVPSMDSLVPLTVDYNIYSIDQT